MADFNSKKPSATYESILNVGTADNQSIDGTLRVIEDGRGTDSALKLSTGAAQVDNIKIDANTISSEDSNGHIILAPNGTGDVQLNTDTLQVGDGDAAGSIQSNGDFNVVLKTGNSTTGSITITDGANGAIAITPNGTGDVDISKVDIDSGAIDNTTVGASTASTGAFTTLSSKGDSNRQFDVYNSSNHEIFTIDNSGGTDEVVVNTGGIGTVDFRVESVDEDKAFFVDASTNKVYINEGAEDVDFEVSNNNAVILNVDSTGIIFNSDQHATNDFTIKTSGEDEAFFVDSGNNTIYINKGGTAFKLQISNINDQVLQINDAAGAIFNNDEHATNDFRVASNSGRIDDSHCFFINSGAGTIGIGEDSPDALLHAKTASTSAFEVLKLEQLDVDEAFIKFTGTSASDQTKSLSTDTSVGALTGHILVNINDTDYWIPFYAKN